LIAAIRRTRRSRGIFLEDKVNNNFWKQFAIALALFLLGYFTFNGNLFT